jgi:NDP-sugar pyrophosphorylase family protein
VRQRGPTCGVLSQLFCGPSQWSKLAGGWHVMKLYDFAGIREFIIWAGYKAQYIKRYFADYFLQENDVEVELGTGAIRYLRRGSSEQGNVTVIDKESNR